MGGVIVFSLFALAAFFALWMAYDGIVHARNPMQVYHGPPTLKTRVINGAWWCFQAAIIIGVAQIATPNFDTSTPNVAMAIGIVGAACAFYFTFVVSKVADLSRRARNGWVDRNLQRRRLKGF